MELIKPIFFMNSIINDSDHVWDFSKEDDRFVA